MSWSSRGIKLLQQYERRRRKQQPIADAWNASLEGEVAFWEHRLRTWRRFHLRLDPTSELQPELVELIDAPPGSTVKILDVGAGLLTWLNKTLPGYTLEITAVDVLGAEYEGILERASLDPPVHTQACRTEELTAKFGHDVFDIVTARNTLDHSYDPIGAMREMISVLKPGCAALLVHSQDVAEKEQYRGMHQWNLHVERDRFTIWRADERVDVADALKGVATVASIEPGALNRVVLRKHPA